MAVQFADKALNEWLIEQINKAKKLVDTAAIEVEAHKKSSLGHVLISHSAFERRSGYLYALQDVQKQLHELWGE
jgi:hypothetical protein